MYLLYSTLSLSLSLSLSLALSLSLSLSQAVIDDDGTPSTFSRLNRGVPQGSVLGPLLFLIFINDIGNGFSNVFSLIYADDLQLYVTFPLAEFSVMCRSSGSSC